MVVFMREGYFQEPEPGFETYILVFKGGSFDGATCQLDLPVGSFPKPFEIGVPAKFSEFPGRQKEDREYRATNIDKESLTITFELVED